MNPPTLLRMHRSLMRAAFSGANAFAWIFIFQYFSFFHHLHEALARTALLYALVYAISSLVTPYAAGRLRHGMKRGIAYGAALAALAFVSLGFSFEGFFGYQYVDGIVAFALLLGAYRALYWVPYSVESHELRPGAHSSFPLETLIALMPAAAGIALQAFLAPAWLLFAAGLCIVLSLVPLARLPDVYEKFSWGYEETFAQLFARKHRAAFLRAVLDGAQSAALFFLWPIAIFLIVGSSYLVLGTVLSITFFIALLLREPVRRLVRRLNIRDVSVLYAAVAMSAWIGRVLVASPFGIVLVDAYFHTGTAGREGMDHPALDHAADGGSFVDEYTALKEVGLAFGRIIMCIIAAVFAILFSVSVSFLVSFILVAAAAGASVWLAHKSMIREI